MNRSHLDDGPINLDDALAPTEDRPAPAVELPRPKPISEIPKWGLKPVAIRSRYPLEASF